MLTKSSITIRDVAQAAGVSKTTAVYILNNTPSFKVPHSTRQKVNDAAVRLGYRRNGVAAALSRGRIQTIGVLVPLYEAPVDVSSFGSTYAKDILMATISAARRADLRVTLLSFDENGTVPTEDSLIDGRVDGLILVSPHNEELVRRIYDSGFPCVSIGSDDAGRPIRIDDRGGARLAVEYLVSLGHRRIACRIADAPSRVGKEREIGFIEGIARAGLNDAFCPRLPDCAAVVAALHGPDTVRPTAVVVYNDWRAFEIVDRARREGLLVPANFSIIGFDNNILAEACFPSLTTIHNPLDALADKAIKVLQALWRGEEDRVPPSPVPVRLVVRESTGPVPGGVRYRSAQSH